MIILEAITPRNPMVFKDIPLRALQESPTAFSSTYSEESKLTDADWFKRAMSWSGVTSVGYLAMDDETSVGIAAEYYIRMIPGARTLCRCGSRRPIAG